VQAGLTWWIEALGGWLGTPADALTRVRQGPPVQPPGERLPFDFVYPQLTTTRAAECL